MTTRDDVLGVGLRHVERQALAYANALEHDLVADFERVQALLRLIPRSQTEWRTRVWRDWLKKQDKSLREVGELRGWKQ